ncbi:MAG: hypothetical protein ACFNZJ_06145 [Parascardovia denticolens]
MSHRSPADSPSDPSSPSKNHPRNLLRSLKRFLPVSSRSFHGYEGEFRDKFDQTMRAVSDQTGMIRDLQRRLDESQAQVRDLRVRWRRPATGWATSRKSMIMRKTGR